jgi:hypothetical protein
MAHLQLPKKKITIASLMNMAHHSIATVNRISSVHKPMDSCGIKICVPCKQVYNTSCVTRHPLNQLSLNDCKTMHVGPMLNIVGH